MSQKIAFVDLDGTLANYDRGMIEHLCVLNAGCLSAEEISGLFKETSGSRERPIWLENQKQMVHCLPEFWESLSVLAGGWAALVELQSLDYEIHIVTKIPRSALAVAAKAKIEWCRKHLALLLGLHMNLHLTTDKKVFKGDLLMDDWPPYIDAWLKTNPDGVVWMPSWGYNGNYTPPVTLASNFRRLDMKT